MLSLRPEQIGSMLSMTPVPGTFAELDERVSRGIPKSALRAIVDRIVGHNEQATDSVSYRPRRHIQAPQNQLECRGF